MNNRELTERVARELGLEVVGPSGDGFWIRRDEQEFLFDPINKIEQRCPGVVALIVKHKMLDE